MIITNNFHNTEVIVDRAKPLNSNAIRRIKQALCGHADCTCSDSLGGRGKQPTGYDDLLAHAESQLMFTRQPQPLLIVNARLLHIAIATEEEINPLPATLRIP